MRINSISNQNTQNKQSFKGVNIFASEWSDLHTLGVWVTKHEEDDAVEFIQGRSGSLELGKSQAAKTLTEMVRNLGQKVTESENMKKVRALLTQVVETDIIPVLEKPRDYDGQAYTYKDRIGGERVLSDIKTAAQKGILKYHAKDSTGKGSYEVLSIELDPKEKINVSITREELAQLGKPQP